MAKNDSKVVRRGVYLYIDDQEITNDIKSIQKEMNVLVSAQKRMTVGSEEYIKAGRKIRTLRGIITEHNAQLRSTGTQLDNNALKAKNFSEVVSKNYGKVIGIIGSLTGSYVAMQRATEDYLNLDSSYSNLIKYTGMTRDEVIDLNEAFKDMDTKTARIELNNLAADAGRLGITAKESILEFVEAGDIIRVALGEDLGDDAIKNIGKLAMVFGDSDRMGLRGAMLATGSAINEIAQTSSASEPYLVDFTGRLAGIGNQANLTIAQLIGYGSVLDQNKQNVEKSATALSRVIIKMFQEPAKFAKAAGLEVNGFTKLLKEDANEALLQFVQGLAGKGGLSELSPVFKALKLNGDGVAGTLSVLAKNVDSVRQQQQQATDAFNDGTSVINEFNVKNNDLTAIMEKQKKEFQERVYQLGELLLPVMMKIVQGSTTLLGVLGDLIKIGIQYGDVIITITAATAAYTVAVKLNSVWLEREILLTKASTVAQYAKRASIHLLNAAYYLLTGRITLATRAMQAFSLITKISPVGLISASVAALVVGLTALYKRMNSVITVQKALNNLTSEANKNTRDQRAELEKNWKIASNDNIQLEKRKEAIKAINDVSPAYLGNISLETINTDKATVAKKKYIEELKKEAMVKAAEAKITEQTTKLLEVRAKLERLEEAETNIGNSNLPLPGSGFAVDRVRSNFKKEEERILSAIESYSNVYKSVTDSIAEMNIPAVRTFHSVQKELSDTEQQLKDLLGANSFYKSTLNLPIDELVENAKVRIKELKTELKTLTPKVPTGGDDDPDDDKKKKNIFLKVELEYGKKRAAIKERYLSGDIKTQEEYNSQIELLELELLKAKLKVAGIEPKQREQIEQQILDARIKVMQEITKLDDTAYLTQEEKNKRDLEQVKKKYDDMAQIIERAYTLGIIPTEEEKLAILTRLRESKEKEEAKSSEKVAEDRLKQKDKDLQKEIFLLNERRIQENLTEKQYNDELNRITKASLSEKLKTIGLSEEQILNIQREMQDMQIDELIEFQEKQREKWEQTYSIIQDIATSLGEAIGTIFSAEVDGYKDFAKQILIIALDALEKMVMISQTKLMTEALASLNPALIARSIASIAAIKVLFSAAKAAVSNFYDGGYTPSGAWDKPQGIVHSNEFVSNRFAVRNPNLRPVFDLIDHAQRNNTVSNLTGDDIASVVSRSGRTSSTFPSISVNSNQNVVNDKIITSLLVECIDTMNKVKDRFDYPILSETYIDGKGGINNAQKLLEKMQTNASRKTN